MKKRIISTSIVLLILASATALGFNYIRAQTPPPALVVHPSNLDLTLKPGSPITGVIYVMNTTHNAMTIKTSLRNFTAQGEEGGVDITTNNTPFSLASWITVSPDKIEIPAGKEVAFTYTISPPENAEPGGHFGSVVFATVPSTTSAGGAGSAVSEEIASLILAKIPGNTKESAHVESFSANKSFYEFGPVTFTMRVKNNSDVHIQPFGAIQITNMLGEKMDAPILPTNVLPGAVRKITVVFPNTLLIGKYTATIVASYGSKNQPLIGGTTFYAFPIRFGAIALVIIIILFLMRKRLWKSFKVLVLNK